MQYQDFDEFDKPYLIDGIRNSHTYTAHYCVGWLGNEHDFPVGKLEHDIIAQIWRASLIPAIQFKGYHNCQLCKHPFGATAVEFDGQVAKIGCGIIAVESQPGVLLVAPDLILHYVLSHEYLPPSELLEAICAIPTFKCDTPPFMLMPELQELEERVLGSGRKRNLGRANARNPWSGVAGVSLEVLRWVTRCVSSSGAERLIN